MNKHVYLYDVNDLYKCMYAYKSPSVNKQTHVENPGKPTMCRSFPRRVSPWVLHFFCTVYPRAGTYWITMALVVLGEHIDGCLI